MSDIEHRHLRSALEFAVMIAAEGQKRRPPLEYPKALKAYLSRPRLPSGALGRVRRAIESDERFRTAIAAGALPELVDDVGRLWLEHGADWETQAADLIRARREEAESRDLERELKRADKRRIGAEQAAARLQVELLARDERIEAAHAEIDELRADVAKAADSIETLRAELIDTRNENRHARDREAAAVARAEAAARDRRIAPVEAPPDEQSQTASFERRDLLERSGLLEAMTTARDLVVQLQSLVDDPPLDEADQEHEREPASSRRPLDLPGGVISTSGRAAAHLLRSGAVVLIDGYNVAKSAWPDQDLERQRDALTARVENLARRHGSDITIVFDGSSIPGAHSRDRRLVRVVFSPEGVTADDVIRAEVERVPSDRAVVVVTNDREIVTDVRRAGANVVPTNAFIAVL